MQDSFDARIHGQTPETVARAKSGKGWMICSILALVLLVGVSAYAIMLTLNKQGGSSSSNDVAKLQQEIAAKDEKLDKIKEAVGVESVDAVTPEVIASKTYDPNYIYFPEAGMKIKIPDTIKNVSYLHHSRGSITFWAVPKGFQYFPDFADPAKNQDGLFSIIVSKKVEDRSAACNSENIPSGLVCTGTRIMDAAVDGYEILYNGPQAVYSRDATSAKDESTAIQALRDVIANPENYSEI